MASRSQCISKAQGLNAQAKVEVLLSRRDGAAEIFLLVTTQRSRNLVVRVHLEVRTSGADLGLEQSVVVLRVVRRWPALDPLFFLGGEAKFRDQDNSVVLIAPNMCVCVCVCKYVVDGMLCVHVLVCMYLLLLVYV